ncbi:hypothetical protein [Tengunoibacter tsumagoiensis]|uniref:Uncharacterized protein n=1 Tax=Tengunoibacter tsumagoiensis TaxID=2014871 RepID=A0A402A7M5_9CHLR|nr:hypothetical protein [Tengunoibacter tsumagoiensis]GCE15143.1 hypothetical protein KTT_50020 [Tengunoibacter tsumagoiensis]
MFPKKTLQAGIVLPGVVSCDTGAWNGLFGREHEKRRTSGLSVVDYSLHVSYPAYSEKVAHAQQKPQQHGLHTEFIKPISYLRLIPALEEIEE